MATLLTAGDLTRAQAAFTPLLTLAATVTRPEGLVADAEGGYDTTATQTYSGLCALAPQPAPPVQDSAGAAVAVSSWLVSFPAGTNVQSGDTVNAAGRVFVVQGLQNGPDFEVLRSVVAQERVTA